jgi:hypothetical protein
VLDELEEHEIKYILYADDGLFYSEKTVDFLTIAQTILDKHRIGAHFAEQKCKWIKREGEWLSTLQFVGLNYDPWQDILRAATRNGATLKLEVGAIAAFSETENRVRDTLPEIQETDYTQWNLNNSLLFDTWEKLYVEEGTAYEQISADIKSLAELTYKVMNNRLMEYDPKKLAECVTSSQKENTFIEFLTPLKLLKNIDKESFYQLIARYETDHADFPWDVLFKNATLMEKYWMDNISPEEMKKVTKEKREFWFGNKIIEVNNSLSDNSKENGNKPTIDTMIWFADLPEVPESLKPYFKDGECELGEWFTAAMKEADLEQLPDDVKEIIKNKTGKLGYTKVNWRNLFMDPAFATFIARLFQNSFKSEVVKQNFKLTQDHKKDNLVKLINRHIGKSELIEILGQQGLNTFNSTSICSSLLMKLSESWSKYARSNIKFGIHPYERVYHRIIKKIANRRAESDKFFEAYTRTNKWNPLLVIISSDLKKSEYVKHSIFNTRLNPVEVPMFKKAKKSKLHLLKKYKKIKPLHINAITRHLVTTTSMHSKFKAYKGRWSSPTFKGNCWDTLAPKVKR